MSCSLPRSVLVPFAVLAVGLGLAAAAPAPAAPVAPLPAAAARATPVAPGTWRVDGVHSSVVFRIQHMGVSNFYGAFKDMAGQIVVDEADVEGASVEFTVQAESIDTRNAKRDQHAMSPDFLNAKEFPEISFKSTKVTAAGENKWTVEGDFTLHGVTKPISVTAERTGEAAGRGGRGRIAGFEVHFEFKRSDYGMDNMLDALGDEMGVIVSLETALQE
jgi:polyisoprenoid-binding protein YceI